MSIQLTISCRKIHVCVPEHYTATQEDVQKLINLNYEVLMCITEICQGHSGIFLQTEKLWGRK